MSKLEGVAIVGLAGRFPGARNPTEFWEHLKNGVESISQFSVGDLQVRNARSQSEQPNYVRARAVLEDIDKFDAAFFGIYPKEAEVMDPQHRVFLECCWEAMEDAGSRGADPQESVGVFAGCSPNSYFLTQVCRDKNHALDYAAAYQVADYNTMLGTIADTFATRVAYKLNLRGPAVTLLCACSTSLVAVCQACTSLLTYQCDAALAGGVSITLPQQRGYLYQAGGMVSPDGHCRTFDVDAQGTVFGSGAGVVLLKRLEDAVTDRDHIYAVIKGFAVNNDGSTKVGFTAPSVDGQAQVIATAQALAGVNPRSISYIEAHGTATPLGDPIEIAALTQVFRAGTSDTNFCALGTAKTNVGHLDVAAGVTGLIKVALSMKHRQLPPILHFNAPNPKLNLASSPFYVNHRLTDWKPPAGDSLLAGVSAFGVGGTNAHVVVGEPPAAPNPESHRAAQLLVLSARSANALETAAKNLAQHLEDNPELSLSDCSLTLAAGRRAFDRRRAIVCTDTSEAIVKLRSNERVSSHASKLNPQVCFLFPGQGSQRPGMAFDLYRHEPVFRTSIDVCCEIWSKTFGADLRDVLYATDADPAGQRIHQTEFAQPCIFVTEYALAQLWISWGVRPSAMVGHSVGEFVAACLAQVLSLEDALTLVGERARLMQTRPPGAMLSVRLSEQELRPYLDGQLSLAAVNGPALCVVSGLSTPILDLKGILDNRGIVSRTLKTSHAFHSSLMDPVLFPFDAVVRRARLSAPMIPYLSTATGDWITESQATNPEYWVRHLRETVRFSNAIQIFRNMPNSILLEIGAGNTLQTLARQHPAPQGVSQAVVSTLPSAADPQQTDQCSVLEALGALWSAGVAIDWDGYFAHETRCRVSLPTYPFERSRFWIESPETADKESVDADSSVGALSPDIQMDGKVEDRKSKLSLVLTSLIEDLSGSEKAGIDPKASFLELGFDSLFLTQVAQALQARFRVNITFRQLLEELNSIEAIAGYLEDCSPEAETEVVSKASVSPSHAANTPGPAANTDLHRILTDQLQAMSNLIAQQLEVIRGGASVPKDQTGADASLLPSAVKQKPPSKPEFKPFGPYKPVQLGNSDQLTPVQREHLSAFIGNYTRRTAKSKEFTQRYRRVLADPRVVSGFRSHWKEMVYPIVTNRSRGSRLWDVDGNEYIDILNGFGPIALGHLPDCVRQAAHQQLEEGIEIGPQTRLAGEVAELLCDITGMERTTFCNTGSEAVMAALRLARTVTGRSKVVYFSGDYHGNFDEVLAKRAGAGGKQRTVAIAPGIPMESVQNVVVLEYGSPEALLFIEENARDLAAILVEPVQSRHPSLQPVEFLRKLRDITTASGTALIFDEIVTGFRLHLGGAQAYYGIRADLATYGKVLGGGFPIGAIAGSARFMDALDGGAWNFGDESFPEAGVTFFAGTFVRHPLALAASKAVLNELKNAGPALQEDLARRTTELVAHLNQIFADYELPSRIESCGSIFYFSFPSNFRYGSLLYYQLRHRGIHIQEGFPCFLTTAHSDADLKAIVNAFDESLAEMSAATFVARKKITSNPAFPESIQVPMTESQLEILLSAKLGTEANCSFNEAFTLSLRGQLNDAALRSSIESLIRRHEALRSAFNLDSRTMCIHSGAGVSVDSIDFSNDANPNRELKTLIEHEGRTAFDLDHGPLVRVKLVKLEPQHHVVVFTSHHIVCDGWSTNILIEELGALYTAATEGTSANLEQVLPFSKYAESLHQELGIDAGKEIEWYWLNQFQQLPPLLDLPLDRPRPSVKGYAGATVRRILDASTLQTVKRAGASQGCTLFVTLLAGFEALLHRLTGQDDLVVGIPAAAQSLVQGHTLVGHCVNFLPVRLTVDRNAPFSKLLGQAKKALLDAYDHQKYTFGTLVRKLGIPRDPSRLPLIEVQFNVERLGKKSSFGGLTAEVDACGKQFVNFDVFLNIVETPTGLTLDCDYNTDLFDERTIVGWLRCYENMLLSAAESLNQSIGRLHWLGDAERHNVLVERNRTEAQYPLDATIHSLFEEQAKLRPEKLAVISSGQSMNYRKVNDQADKLALILRAKGAGPGRIVAVLFERGVDMVVALLGVLKAGAAYLPLDPNYPKDRLNFILLEAQPLVVLTQTQLASELAPSHATVICLDSDWGEETNHAVSTTTQASSDDLAYVIYTSGSTGKPKGVEIGHRAVVNFLYAMRREPGLSPEDHLLAVTTLSFDIAALEIFLPLTAGATVSIATREETMDGSLLAKTIKDSGISIMQATPSSWRLLLDAGWSPGQSLKMLCGGEPLPADLAKDLLHDDAELWNMYGPTETTIWSAVTLVADEPGPIRIGKPIANTQFYVLDVDMQPQPVGVPGELYIGGDGLANGYFKRPELTSEKFVANPFSENSGAKLYRTGDLVKACPDGRLEFLGRLDNQVKIRGFRIELGEIEAVLRSHAGIREVVVSVWEERGHKQLVAYFTNTGQVVETSHLKALAAQVLPPYMIPAFYVPLTEIPRTPNGKLNRTALPKPEPSSDIGVKSILAPRNEREKTLAAICSEVLMRPFIGMDDNLFELGADSIQIFRIVARANRVGFHLTAAQILRNPSIERIIETAASQSSQNPQPTPKPIVRVSREAYRLDKQKLKAER